MGLPKKKTAVENELFKTKASQVKPGEDAVLAPPKDVAKAIDNYRGHHDQIKHLEGEETVFKNIVLSYARPEFARRLIIGKEGSFKILGQSQAVTYVVTTDANGLSEDEISAMVGRWGKKKVDKLITPDFGGLKFDPKVLEANYDAVVKALSVLPAEVRSSLFKPMAMKAVPGAAKIAAECAKDTEDLAELLAALKIKTYLK